MNGLGKMTTSEGLNYEGKWGNGELTGDPVLKFANGDIYQGKSMNGLPEGKGRMQYATGEVYEGEFVRGLRQGRGILIRADGTRYMTRWENDMPLSFAGKDKIEKKE
jgi:hypothetical protein